MKPTDKSKHSKVVYNMGTRPVSVKRTAKEHIVIHPRRYLRLENVKADNLIKAYHKIVLYEDYLKEKKDNIKKEVLKKK